MLALYKIGKLKVHIYSIKAGSIIVTLKIIIEDSQFPKDLSAIDLMFSLLHQNSMFHLDLQSSAVNGKTYQCLLCTSYESARQKKIGWFSISLTTLS